MPEFEKNVILVFAVIKMLVLALKISKVKYLSAI